ncbi:DUF1579 family protein [Parapedobacter sp. DT-150]|uniref:DUF1579 family protein n=1 Tax=Parapedobacter sp. DT-150 TaxID=3396162 RepID=UPI003F1B764E
MKKPIISLILLLASITLHAQEMDAWTRYMMPSDTHQLLSIYKGDFDMEITMWMDEGQEPMVVKVISVHDTILGGRFLEMKQSGNMMGMDYHSVMTLGFNNTDEQFVMTTLTNMGTGILSLAGPWNPESRTATLIGQLTNPVSKNPIHVRQQVTFVDNDTILIQNVDREGNGAEKKSIQYKLTRMND